MQSVAELLDAIKERRNLTTDSALAAALGVSRQTVNNWRQGRNTPDPVACATIAGLTGEPLALVMGIAGEQRAISREEKAVWRKLAATAMTLAIGLSLALPVRAEAVAKAFQATPSYTLCEMSMGSHGTPTGSFYAGSTADCVHRREFWAIPAETLSNRRRLVVHPFNGARSAFWQVATSFRSTQQRQGMPAGRSAR
ncbi:DUF3693 domain-containing protein [Xanthomonas campestris]|uniref:DUF3693 domain-containing protein n=1 Tax=Xanthomonas campestris TaxID=339 RepID=UPI00388DFADD